MPLTLGELGTEGKRMSEEAERDFDSPADFLDAFVEGLGHAAVTYWSVRDPVQAYCAGVVSGLVIAEKGSDD